MCFTVNVNIIKEELENRYGGELIDHENHRPSYYYHAYSFPELPVVIRETSAGTVLRLLKWGLIPSWTATMEDATKLRGMTLNARSESILEKPAFSDSFRQRRCIVPVRGFFEWKHEAGKKIPYYIFNPQQPVMSLAGLFDRWTSPDGTSTVYSFSVITTSANTMMAEIHNTRKRMPVIINRSDEEEWLYQGTGTEKLRELMKSYPDGILEAHTISPMIGNSRVNRNTPDIIKPYSYPRDQTLF